MGQQDKRRQKLAGAGRNVRLEDAKGALEAAGFACRRGGNGHWRCYHEAAGVTVDFAGPHGREAKLLPVYVKEIRAALETVEVWQQEHGEGDAE